MSVVVEELTNFLLGEVLNAIPGLATAQQNAQMLALLDSIATTVDSTATLVEQINANLVQNLPSIFRLLNTINDNTQTLLFQVGQPQQAGIAVRLPTHPPPGYGGASSSDVATAVWEFPQPAAADDQSGDLLAGAGLFALAISNAQAEFKLGLEPGWMVRGAWANQTSGPFDQPDPFNVAAILPTDTSVTAFLNRLNPGTYTADDFGRAFVASSTPGTDWVYVTQWGTLEFDEFQRLGTSTSVRVPPVWPGLSNVTLGSTLALSNGLVVPGPLDGLIVVISTVAPPIGNYQFGSVRSFARIGAVLFKDDDNHYEFPYPLGPELQVCTPREIQHPASAIIRLQSGVTGTVTPWVAT